LEQLVGGDGRGPAAIAPEPLEEIGRPLVEQGYDGVVTGAFEVLADEDTRLVKSLLSTSAEELNAAVADALSLIKP
jgi:hypothetical protein